MVNGIRASDSYPVPESRLDYDPEIIGDDLDDLLDQAGPSDASIVSSELKCDVLTNNYIISVFQNISSHLKFHIWSENSFRASPQ